MNVRFSVVGVREKRDPAGTGSKSQRSTREGFPCLLRRIRPSEHGISYKTRFEKEALVNLQYAALDSCAVEHRS
jgi:hypothetical protein